MPNRLAGETSPYLQQHAGNPVDWYPWGVEAFERARTEARPILLSIGYSACHWCHVMEHESFEDDETARLMNEHFVNIKVDREERPDVDSIYMSAVQAMTGHGGWPMTVFLLPDGSPFYGGTYFPPEPRHGLPSFRQVLRVIAEAYHTRHDEVAESAAGLRGALEQSTRLRAPAAAVDVSILDGAYRRMAGSHDTQYGGFGTAPKFPQPLALEFMLRQYARTGDEQPLRLLRHTLRQMADGGLYDQLGGGFHRYSVDRQWVVPHFEKMLYDNALLARLYARAYQATGEPALRRVAEQTLDYVRREMTAPAGGFYSAQDADSEGEEGRFYVWQPDEVDGILGAADGELFRRYYDVTHAGNFEGSSILRVTRDATSVAVEAGIDVERLEAVLARGRAALYEVRSRREWPARDEKVLTSWNALMLQAYAVAAQVFGRTEDRDAAVRNAEFLLQELRTDGRLHRTWRDGVARIDAFLEDYALLADALLSLYETTFDVRWIREARALGDRMLELFWDDDESAFYDAATGDETLLMRPRNVDDNATPAGNSAATLLLLRLSVFTGEPRYERIAVRVLQSMAQLLERAPLAFGHLLAAADFHLATPQEVAIIGQADAGDTLDLLGVVRERYRPNTILAVGAAEQRDDGTIPLLAGRTALAGRATAYVCQRFACRRPVTGADALRAELDDGMTQE
jgi:uncharacterized protein